MKVLKTKEGEIAGYTVAIAQVQIYQVAEISEEILLEGNVSKLVIYTYTVKRLTPFGGIGTWEEDLRKMVSQGKIGSSMIFFELYKDGWKISEDAQIPEAHLEEGY